MTSDDEQTIRAIDAAWSQALERKDLDGVMANYAEEAVLLPTNAPAVVGRAAIRARFAGRMEAPGYAARFATARVVVAKAGDMAWETGAFHVTMDGDDGRPVAHTGKHLVVWQKSEGRWLVVAESLTLDS